MKIVIFGIGEMYRRNKSNISKEDEVIALIDNNKHLHGTKCDGIDVLSPTELSWLSYEKIVIMSAYYIEMRDQLIQMGCRRESILSCIEYINQQLKGRLSIYYSKNMKQEEKKCLIITTPLDYKGGSITAAYTALELQNKGYEAVIAAPNGSETFIDEFNKFGITFFLYPNLQFAKWEELFWIKYFDKIIVNTYPMILCAIEISRHRTVMMWLHESDVVYPVMDYWKDIILDNVSIPNMKMYAVSQIARENFFYNVSKCEIGLLPYGIPDMNKNVEKIGDKLTFAVIANIHPIKGQHLFLEAAKQLNKTNQGCEFLIIGDYGDVAEYTQKVEKEAGKIPNVRITGRLTRKEMEYLYNQIDVVVVTSLQETMSLTATEAMMYGKACILSEIAGMAQYVKQGENGFIFKTNDINDLIKQMNYCIKNKEALQKIGENAKKTYYQHFTMDALGNRLEEILA